MTGNVETLPVMFDKQGHRGCRGLMPENTIPAMLRALDLGVTTFEIDACITKDRKVILSHEPFFNHEISTKPGGSYIEETREKEFNIYEMDYLETMQYDVGMKPHPRFPLQEKMNAIKPLLSDVFTVIKKEMMTRKRPFPFFNIETKTTAATDGIFHPRPAEFIELLMTVTRDNGMEPYVIIQSFDPRTLQYLHRHYPAIKTALLIDATDHRSLEDQFTALGFTPTIYSPSFGLVNALLVKKCHEQHVRIIPWTVNDKSEIAGLRNMGVDGIITDFPNLFNE